MYSVVSLSTEMELEEFATKREAMAFAKRVAKSDAVDVIKWAEDFCSFVTVASLSVA